MKFYEYIQHYAWGIGDPKYVEIDDDMPSKDIGDYLDSAGFLDNWSDKWRRVTWKKVKGLPQKEIKEEIESLEAQIKYSKERLREYKELLAITPPSAGDVEITVNYNVVYCNFECWAVVSDFKTKKVIYKGRKDKVRSKVREKARKWCCRNNYEIKTIKILSHIAT